MSECGLERNSQTRGRRESKRVKKRQRNRGKERQETREEAERGQESEPCLLGTFKGCLCRITDDEKAPGDRP